MKVFLSLLSLWLAAIPAAAQNPECAGEAVTPQLAAEGWRPLSTQAAASAWTGGRELPFPAEAWSFVGDCLHLHRPGKGGSLFSAENFQDFELAFEWKIAAGGNSGVKYLAVDGRIHPAYFDFGFYPVGGLLVAAVLGGLLLVRVARRRPWIFSHRWGGPVAWALAFGSFSFAGFLVWVMTEIYQQALRYPPGIEYQITDDRTNKDALSKPTHRSAAAYDFLPPEGAVLRPLTEFNESRILVRGHTVEHWLNGRLVLRFQLGSPELRAAVAASKFKRLPGMAEKHAGRLELQNHGDQVWFRAMKIRALRPQSPC